MAHYRLAMQGGIPEDLPDTLAGHDVQLERIGRTRETIRGRRVTHVTGRLRTWDLPFGPITEEQYEQLVDWTRLDVRGRGPFHLFVGENPVPYLVTVGDIERTVTQVAGLVIASMALAEVGPA